MRITVTLDGTPPSSLLHHLLLLSSPYPFTPSALTVGVLDKSQSLHSALVRLLLEGHPLLLQLRTRRVDVVTGHGDMSEASVRLLVPVIILEVGLSLCAVIPRREGGRG